MLTRLNLFLIVRAYLYLVPRDCFCLMSLFAQGPWSLGTGNPFAQVIDLTGEEEVTRRPAAATPREFVFHAYPLKKIMSRYDK